MKARKKLATPDEVIRDGRQKLFYTISVLGAIGVSKEAGTMKRIHAAVSAIIANEGKRKAEAEIDAFLDRLKD